MENRIIFKIKTGYYLKLLSTETMKLLESTKNKITKQDNDKNVTHLEIADVVLVHCKIFGNSYQQESCIHLFPINRLVNYQISHPKSLRF